MRKGFLSALGISLLSGAMAHGQTQTLPPLTPQEARPGAVVHRKSGEQVIVHQDHSAPSRYAAAPRVEGCNGCCETGCTGLRPWFSAEYLIWWVKDGPINTPLATLGSPTDAIPGALNQPGTNVLFGGDVDYRAFSGIRLSAGVPLSQGLSIEGSYFLLERRSVNYNISSDAAGNPLIARPFFDEQTGQEAVFLTSNPGFGPGAWSGDIAISTHTRFQGYEINLAARVSESSNSRLDLIAGYRSLDLNEDLSIHENLTALTPGALTFVGNFLNAGDKLSEYDRFHTSNKFYGGQIGIRWERDWDRLTLGLNAKIALGWVQTVAELDGSATHITPGGTTTVPGSVLIQASNEGRHFRSDFSVVPEVGVTLGYKISDHLKATFGYNFLYWTNVARPGDQIDRTVNPALAPTHQLFGNGLGTNRPAFAFQDSDFWAQGLTFGLHFSF